MIEAFAMSVGNGFSQLPEQRKTLIEGKPLAMRREKAIEANSGGVMVKYQGGARLAFAKIESPQNAGMIYAFEHFEFALRRPRQPIAVFG
jgi:hypothetical protein